MRKRAGDTLIEVALAVGIFSMVAIAVVAVMNGGTSSTQTALETTLTREEIDTQAEALRFIQSAYIADKDSGTNNSNPNGIDYRSIWERFQSNGDRTLVIDAEKYEDAFGNSSFGCSAEDYENDNFKKHAFIINPNNMELITPDSGTVTFAPASTYPRLIASNKEESNLLSDGLVDSTNEQKLSRAEGIYVIAVRDNKTTNITQPNNTDVAPQSAFIDFYIRTCWYGAGEDTPSTIATTIRLYDPDTTSVASEATGVWVEFNPNNRVNQVEVEGKMNDEFVGVNNNAKSTNGFTRRGYDLVGWSINRDSTPSDVRSNKPGTYNTINDYKAPPALAFNDKITLYAIWQTNYFLEYDTGWADWSPARTDCDIEYGCTIPNRDIPDRKGYAFMGWCSDQPQGGICPENKTYSPNNRYPYNLQPNQDALPVGQYNTKLYAIWYFEYKVTYYDTDTVSVISTQTFKVTSQTWPIAIDGSLSPTPPPVSQSGNEMVLLGWSTNKNGSGTIYNSTGENKEYKAKGVTDAVIELYPVWREIITFSNVPWNDTGTTRYCNIIKSDSGISLLGNRRNAVNCGVEFSVGKNDTFELSADLNTSGIFTHPTGLVAVSVGPLVAIITTDNRNDLAIYYGRNDLVIYYGYLPLNKSLTESDIHSASNYTRLDQTTIPNSGSATIKLTKYDNLYSMSVNGKEVKLQTQLSTNGRNYSVINVNDGRVLASNLSASDLNNLKVKYTMIHTSHDCSTIFNAKLYNIRMTKSDIYYNQ